MINNNEDNIDAETIKRIGLQLSNKHINAGKALSARVFEYPNLEDVYIMESDLYGNTMPKDSCFLAFNGPHGLIGKHLKVETLKCSSVTEIEKMVHQNNEG
ncbi:MAG: hypothetical protein ABIN97_11495 [Ginsengibacter sp.]